RISSSVGPGPRQASLLGFCQETGLRCSECRKAQSGRRRQADLTVHGGVDKAVYAYPSEHYPHWVAKYPKMEIPWGTFGENFTTEGLLENEVHVGDRLGVGSAEFAVTQPRFPCYKLGLRFGTQAILKTFLDSERSGYYLKVLREGKIKAGDSIKTIEINENSPTITSMVQMVKRSG